MQHRRHSHHHRHHRTRVVAHIFQPLMDWWVALLIFFLIAVLSAGIPVMLAAEIGPIQKTVAVGVLVIVILYIVDLAFFSYYQLDANGLTVVSQLRRTLFPYRNITEIKPGNLTGLFSFRGKKRFALSANNLLIRLTHEHWRAITVSPVHRQLFLSHLLEQIDHERSSRATVEVAKK